jgi:CheY-like chemotaxis protein
LTFIFDTNKICKNKEEKMGRKLIVADESIIIQKTVELILSEKDFLINAISDGREALRSIKAEVPDIVFADIDLPEMNGYELCSAIKKDPSLKTVSVILLAAAVKGIDEKRAKEAGADDHIIKPFEPEEFLSKIDAAKTLKDIIIQLRNESQRLRNKLQGTEKKAKKINKDLLNKIDAVKTSEETTAQLRKELQQINEKADKIKRESIEKILLQTIPGITDKVVEEIIQGPLRNESQRLMSELKNAIEKAVEEKIPYIVEKVITEEIEKIKQQEDK